MSIMLESEEGYFISHKKYIDSIYKDISPTEDILDDNLFKIHNPFKPNFKKRKKTDVNPNSQYVNLEKDINHVKNSYNSFLFYINKGNILEQTNLDTTNSIAQKTAETVYNETEKHLIKSAFGSNIGPAVIRELENTRFLFPRDSSFYCKDVKDISKHLQDKNYDVIILDPPWWNKYIRRKRKQSTHGYDMLYNNDLKSIPIENLLKDDGIVIVWCTNSPQHLSELQEEIFNKWQVKFIAKWYWLKVTTSGEPVCSFSEPLGKQPFEQIVFGVREGRTLPNPINKKLIVSVPSALHSHKPPLVELIQPFLPANPSCLEIFARYLLPGWTSYGYEALRLQHECLYNL